MPKRDVPWLAALLIATCWACGFVVAQEAAKLTEEQRKGLLAERDRLWSEAEKAKGAGRLQEAIAGLEKVLAIEQRVFGKVHAEVAGTLSWMAKWREATEDFAGARRAWSEMLAIDTELYGKDHWRVTNSRLSLEKTEFLARLTSAQRRGLAAAYELLGETIKLQGQGQYTQAIPQAEKVVASYQRTLGEKHPDIVPALSCLGCLYMEVGDFGRAEPLLQRAVAVSKLARGARDPHYAINLNNLAGLHEWRGNFARAETMYLEALPIYKQAGEEWEAEYAKTASNLGRLYHEQGRYAQAEARFKEAIEINRKVLGEAHPDFAESLNKLAMLYHQQDDNARAETLYVQALTIKKESLGESHPHYLATLNNLAALYVQMGETARAEPLYRQALTGLKATHGESHPNYAKTLHNLAQAYVVLGKYREAEPLFRQAVELEAKVIGKNHATYAGSLDSLGSLYRAMGNYERAESLFREALAIKQRTIGEKHPLYAGTLTKLAEVFELKGDYAAAAPVFQKALSISLEYLDVAAFSQSERKQLAMMAEVRFRLDRVVSLAAKDRRFSVIAFAELLKWKGVVLSRQRALRVALDRPELATVAEDLRRTASRMATLSFATPPAETPEGRKVEIARLSERKEELEAKLATASSEFRAARKELTLVELQAALPSEAALIDFLAYDHSLPNPPGVKGTPKIEIRLAAFVVRKAGEAQFVDLGLLKPIRQAIDTWRTDNGTSPASKQAAQSLRETLWLPLEGHLTGATTVLLSPDGDLGKLPFAALPGKQPGTYLLEDYTLVVVPSPQAVVDLAAPRTARRPAGNLLVVADVNYDSRSVAASEKPRKLFAARAARGESDEAFPPLPGTRGEQATIQKLYRENFGPEGLTTIEGPAASQEAFVREAARHLYLHVATHGYFAPAKFKSALDRATQGNKGTEFELISNQSLAGYHPGLLSGLALAGANKPTEEDDGILTAEEVSSLNLIGVDLAVLSACETGLGQSAGGEGLLGLQRSFQAAGVRTVIASLWKVDDVATRDLMERFYENLWNKGMGKLQALREAQLWMLKERGARGLKEFASDAETGIVNNRRLAPYYWAAFVLSGDWR